MDTKLDPTSWSDDPGLDGPDYLALVIEWDRLAEALEESIEEPIEESIEPTPEPPASRTFASIRWLLAALGVASAIGLVSWGIYRARTA